jgi:hypothetical protein
MVVECQKCISTAAKPLLRQEYSGRAGHHLLNTLCNIGGILGRGVLYAICDKYVKRTQLSQQ